MKILGVKMQNAQDDTTDTQEQFFNRELSWLGFARRVLALVEDSQIPLLERVKFAGIMGMLHDEFFMKRITGLKRQMVTQPKKISIDGRTPRQEFEACRQEIVDQMQTLESVINKEICPAMASAGFAICDHQDLDKSQKIQIRDYFRHSVQPIITPLAVDAEHPFPFVSNLGLNLAVLVPEGSGKKDRFVRIKVPNNRPRWVPLEDNKGFVPLEQVIAANLDMMFGGASPNAIYNFRVTRGAEGDVREGEGEGLQEPGAIIRLVTRDLKARRFAGVVRVKVDQGMPVELQKWLARQFDVDMEDVYPTSTLMGLDDLLKFPAKCDATPYCYPPASPVTHPRLRKIGHSDQNAIFEEIKRGDILLHHPYHRFDTSVQRLLDAAAIDPGVLAIKLTIYRTSNESPIVAALAEAARRGKQVAVLVEVTARFDEAPNIAWGQYLEKEGVHVSYGVEQLKTHVKLALVVREEKGHIQRYLHFGTGNYHDGTARMYEDLGILTCNPDLCEDASIVFNSLTGSTSYSNYRKILVAPVNMRKRFTEMIRREAQLASEGKPCGIKAKMNQLQDANIVRELYKASQAGVPITLNVRGLCTLVPGVPGLSENIKVISVVGRFLEHSRIYAFVNGGAPEYYIGSADWMKRNLNHRVETILPVCDENVKQQIEDILEIYDNDNVSAWDCQSDGSYIQRRPEDGKPARAAQEVFIQMAKEI
jgi:polyphosphate kinase